MQSRQNAVVHRAHPLSAVRSILEENLTLSMPHSSNGDASGGANAVHHYQLLTRRRRQNFHRRLS
jgi:hypothetical protein